MGKDLKGKELGAGIVQRKDKRYVARYISKISGKSVEKYFYEVNEAKNGWQKQSMKMNITKNVLFLQNGRIITNNML